MAKPNEKLARSLDQLRELQRGGKRVFQSKEFNRADRERLLKNGFLRQVIQGWLITTSPGADEGDTTPWYASFWEFCAEYCGSRFGTEWNLSPEQSIQLHAENTVIPTQVTVYAQRATSNVRDLLFGTSIYDFKQKKSSRPPAADIAVKNGLRLISPAAALVKVPEAFFQRAPLEAQVVLAAIRDSSEVLRHLLEGGNSVVASRLAGAFRRAGRGDVADEIASAMKGAGYTIREHDPFAAGLKMASLAQGTLPVVGRIKGLWDTHRQAIIDAFPPAPGLPSNRRAYL